MATSIYWNKKEIYRSSNAIFNGFYNLMVDLIVIKNIILNENLNELIDNLDLCGSGWNLELADYLHLKEDFQVFISLVKQTLDKMYNDIPNLSEDYKKIYDQFYKGLLEAQSSFKN